MFTSLLKWAWKIAVAHVTFNSGVSTLEESLIIR